MENIAYTRYRILGFLSNYVVDHLFLEETV